MLCHGDGHTNKLMKNFVSRLMTPWRRPKSSSRDGITAVAAAWWCVALILLAALLPSVTVSSAAAAPPDFDWTIDSVDSVRTNSEKAFESPVTSATTTTTTASVVAAPVTTVTTTSNNVKSRHQSYQCPVDCRCNPSIETVDCRQAGIRNVSNFLSNQHVIKL